MGSVKDQRYVPREGFEEDTREPLSGLSSSSSTELWLIQWPVNEMLELNGKEISIRLQDGHLSGFEGSSGKKYNLMSYSGEDMDLTVFQPSNSENNIAGKISRRVSVVHYPDPKELVQKDASRKSKHPYLSAGSSVKTSSKSSRATTCSLFTSSNSTRGPRCPVSSSQDGKPMGSLFDTQQQLAAKKLKFSPSAATSVD